MKVLLYFKGEDSPVELEIRSFGDIDDHVRDIWKVIRIKVVLGNIRRYF